MTAAHCLDFISDDSVQYLKIRLGTADMGEPKEGFMERTAKEIKLHPKYQSRKVYFDVGLVILDSHVEFTEYVRPICLPMTPVDDYDYLADELGKLYHF